MTSEELINDLKEVEEDFKEGRSIAMDEFLDFLEK